MAERTADLWTLSVAWSELARRSLDGHLGDLREAVHRARRGAVGPDELLDGAWRFVTRVTDDVVDGLRVLAGLPVVPGGLPVVVREIEEGSQASGPLEVTVLAGEDAWLHVGALVSVADPATTALGPDFVDVWPAEVRAGVPTLVEVRFVGLEQTLPGLEDPRSSLPPGDWLGFLVGRSAPGEDGGDDTERVLAALVLRVVPVRWAEEG